MRACDVYADIFHVYAYVHTHAHTHTGLQVCGELDVQSVNLSERHTGGLHSTTLASFLQV